MSPAVEDESRPCPYSRPEGPCPGRMEPDIEGGLVVWACTYCRNEVYGDRVAQQDACQAGVPAAAQQPGPPAAPVFLGTTIGRRPQ